MIVELELIRPGHPILASSSKKAIAGRRVNRVHPAGQPPSLPRASLFHYRNKLKYKLHVFYQMARLVARTLFRIQNETPLELGLQCLNGGVGTRSDGRHKKQNQLNTISMNFYNKSDHFAVLLLANRMYLLYKV